jgi:hypothetical protein
MKINPIAACFLVFCINAIFIFFGVSLRRSSLRRAIRCNLLFVPHKRIFASIPHAEHTNKRKIPLRKPNEIIISRDLSGFENLIGLAIL